MPRPARNPDPDERPRERLLRNGPRSLSDAELIAVLLKGGRPGAPALELARQLLFRSGGLRGLAGACAESLQRPGVGPVKTATLLAAVEVACRLAAAEVPKEEPLSRLPEVARYIDLRYGRPGQEVMGALYVGGRKRLIGERELYRGTFERAAVEPREVLREGLLIGASAVVLFHTHPSGDPAPSREDVEFTRRMVKAGRRFRISSAEIVAASRSRRRRCSPRVNWCCCVRIKPACSPRTGSGGGHPASQTMPSK